MPKKYFSKVADLTNITSAPSSSDVTQTSEFSRVSYQILGSGLLSDHGWISGQIQGSHDNSNWTTLKLETTAVSGLTLGPNNRFSITGNGCFNVSAYTQAPFTRLDIFESGAGGGWMIVPKIFLNN